MNQNEILAKTVKFAEVTGAALAVAQRISQQRAAEKQAAATQLPLAVDALIAAGLLKQAEREDALRELGDTSKTLKVLTKVAAKFHELQSTVKEASTLNRMGNGIADASQQPREDAYCGRRRGYNDKSAADEKLLRLLPNR